MPPPIQDRALDTTIEEPELDPSHGVVIPPCPIPPCPNHDRGHWQDAWVIVPSNLQVWQRPQGSVAFYFKIIPLVNHFRTSDSRRERVSIVQCIECQAVWPSVETLGVAWALEYELIKWSRSRRARNLRCSCCPVGSGAPQFGPRSYVDGVRIFDF